MSEPLRFMPTQFPNCPKTLADPGLLRFDKKFDDDVLETRDSNKALESIVTPFSKFVIDTSAANNGYNIDCYYRSNDGVSFDITPDTRWEIRLPETDDTFNALSITEVRGDNLDQRLVTTYSYIDESLSSTETSYIWTMTKGIGENRFIEKVTDSASESQEARWKNRERFDSDGNVVASTESKFQMFPWGEELVYFAEISGDLTSQTIHEYYTDQSSDGYGHLKQTTNPDGSWIRYEYDDELLVKIIRPWGDATIDETNENLLDVTEYSYKTISGLLYQITSSDKPKTETRKICGTVVERTFHGYQALQLGETYVETEKRATRVDAGYYDPDNLCTVTTNAFARKGLIDSVTSSDGTADYYTYTKGVYSSTGIGVHNFTHTLGGTDERNHHRSQPDRGQRRRQGWHSRKKH